MFVGRVYRIWAPGVEECYIGSTSQKLGSRFSQHKYERRRWLYDRGNYYSSFLILVHEDAQIELVEEREFRDTKEMRECEKYWKSKFVTVKQKRPLRTRDDYNEDQKVYHAKHRDKQRDKELARYKQYYASHGKQTKTCPHCGKNLTSLNLKRHIKGKHPAVVNGVE